MVGAEPMLKISWMLRAVDFEVRYTIILWFESKRNESSFYFAVLTVKRNSFTVLSGIISANGRNGVKRSGHSEHIR